MRKMSTLARRSSSSSKSRCRTCPPRSDTYLLRSQEQTAANALFDSEMLKFFNDLDCSTNPGFLKAIKDGCWYGNKQYRARADYPWFLQQTSSIAATVFGCAKLKRAAMSQIAGDTVR